jgi:hypothetical protein
MATSNTGSASPAAESKCSHLLIAISKWLFLLDTAGGDLSSGCDHCMASLVCLNDKLSSIEVPNNLRIQTFCSRFRSSLYTVCSSCVRGRILTSFYTSRSGQLGINRLNIEMLYLLFQILDQYILFSLKINPSLTSIFS